MQMKQCVPIYQFTNIRVAPSEGGKEIRLRAQNYSQRKILNKYPIFYYTRAGYPLSFFRDSA